MKYIVYLFFFVISYLPLRILHTFANVLGYLYYFFASSDRKRIRENTTQSGIITDSNKLKRFVLKNCQETIKSGIELPIAWIRKPKKITKLFKKIQGYEYIEQALEKQQSILLLTPHIGSYDLAGRMISELLPTPLTAMYKAPKKTWLEDIMIKGRDRGKVKTAQANTTGVRQLLLAVKNKESIIILPDQVPQAGEGIMSTFFNKPAYTMILASKLANRKDVTTFFFVGERLPKGKGFNLHIFPIEGHLTSDKRMNTQIINNNIEKIIKLFPEQYLFSYNRFKIPAGCENK